MEGGKGNVERGVMKGQVQCRNNLSSYRVDLLMEKRLLQWFFSLRMNFKGCYMTHDCVKKERKNKF